jgi:hypothetical protein
LAGRQKANKQGAAVKDNLARLAQIYELDPILNDGFQGRRTQGIQAKAQGHKLCDLSPDC